MHNYLVKICLAAVFLLGSCAIASGIWNIVNGIDIMASIISIVWVTVGCLTIYLEHKKIISRFAANAIWIILIIECLIDILTSDISGLVFWLSIVTCIVVLIGTIVDCKEEKD